MIDVLRSVLADSADTSWRALVGAASLLASPAALFLVSTCASTEPSPPLRADGHVPSPEPRSSRAHWGQLMQGIEARIQAARKVTALQSAALVQIDAADFTLARIIDDLSAVMPRAADLRARPARPLPVTQGALAA